MGNHKPTATVLDSVLSSGDVVAKLIGNDPWQQFVDAIDGTLGDASYDVAQVGLGIKAIQFGGSCRIPRYAEAVRIIHFWLCDAVCAFGIVWGSLLPFWREEVA